MLNLQTSLLAVIDVQERLMAVMAERQKLVNGLQRLLRAGALLGLPVVWAEQNPARLGPTIAEVRALLAPRQPVTKMAFNCWLDPGFRHAVETTGRRQILLAGIETHVCIYQTARAMHDAGFEVEVVADAVASRSPEHRSLALARLMSLGIPSTCVEMALFELLQTAEAPAFRDILALVK